ncbi:MAG: PadR family transcriptional regulator [Anaerolineales bacterium]
MSLKHAILGFLSFRDLSGYDLKKGFDRSVRHFWPANQSQIYRTLTQLDEEGFVQKEVVEREERLDMKIYSITDAGRAELHQWLSTPLPELDNREPFLIQVFFGGQLSNEEIIDLMKAKLKSIEERLAVYKIIYQSNQTSSQNIENKRAVFLSLLTLEVGYQSDQTSAVWLRSAIQRIQNKDYSISITEN